jgi:hypothetical protein
MPPVFDHPPTLKGHSVEQNVRTKRSAILSPSFTTILVMTVDIAVVGCHKVIPKKDFHFPLAYASALPNLALPR